MKKFKFTLRAYFSFAFLALVTYACCDEIEYRITGDSQISVLDQFTAKIYDSESLALVTGPFQVNLFPRFEQVASLNQLSQQAYAFSCPEAYLNQLQAESLNLYFDKPFHYKGDSIPAGTNLKSLSELKLEVYFSELNLKFNDTLMDYLDFDSTAYELKVEINTTDGIPIENGIRLQFDLD